MYDKYVLKSIPTDKLRVQRQLSVHRWRYYEQPFDVFNYDTIMTPEFKYAHFSRQQQIDGHHFSDYDAVSAKRKMKADDERLMLTRDADLYRSRISSVIISKLGKFV